LLVGIWLAVCALTRLVGGLTALEAAALRLVARYLGCCWSLLSWLRFRRLLPDLGLLQGFALLSLLDLLDLLDLLLFHTAEVFENFYEHAPLLFDVRLIRIPDKLHVNFPVSALCSLLSRVFLKVVKVFI
jgi:hypothetical protein